MGITIIAVLLSIMQTMPPIPRNATDSTNSTRQTVTKKAQDNKAPTADPSPTLYSVTSIPEHNPTNPPQIKDTEQSITVSKLPAVSVNRNWADWVLWAFNGLLVIAGFLGIRVAYKTLMKISEQTAATEKAAEATERSVRLQEIIQQQWVQVDGWRRHGGSSRDENPPRFSIAAEISNPTNIPLTILGVTMRIGGQTQTLCSGNVLAPSDAPITTDFPITLTPDQIPLYQAYRLILTVIGEVVYVDAFGKHKTQPFSQVCVLGPGNSFRAIPFHQM